MAGVPLVKSMVLVDGIKQPNSAHNFGAVYRWVERPTPKGKPLGQFGLLGQLPKRTAPHTHLGEKAGARSLELPLSMGLCKNINNIAIHIIYVFKYVCLRGCNFPFLFW